MILVRKNPLCKDTKMKKERRKNGKNFATCIVALKNINTRKITHEIIAFCKCILNIADKNAYFIKFG